MKKISAIGLNLGKHIINQLKWMWNERKNKLLEIKSRKKLNGEIPIYCDIFNSTEKSRFATNISTKLDGWDKKRQRVRGNSVEAVIIKSNLDKIKEQIKHIVYVAIKRDEEISPIDIKNLMTGNHDSKPTSLMSVYKIRFETMKKLLGKDYQKTTLIKFNYLANSVQDFLSHY